MWHTLDELDVKGKRVMWRVDFNVPLGENGRVDRVEDWRIRAALPTLEALRSRGARTVVVSHLGEPNRRDPKYSLAPIAAHLAELTHEPVRFVSDVVGPEAAAAADALGPDEVMMLENVRFDPGEAGNDPAFAGRLAQLADAYVSDAFGAAHRAHASIVGLAALRPAAAGLLMEREVRSLGQFLAHPKRPAVAILAGAKAATKLKVLLRLLETVDTVLLGGVLANTVLAARGVSVGASPVDQGSISELSACIDSPKLRLPVDAVVAAAPDAPARAAALSEIQPSEIIYDVGSQTVAAYADLIQSAGSLMWNGPVGLVEIPAFAPGTAALAEAVGRSRAESILGGGDTVAFMMHNRLDRHFTHISTGGGAMLSFLAGERLPALEALGYYRENPKS